MRSLFIRFLRVGLRTAHSCLSVFMLVGLLFPALAAAAPNTAPTFGVWDGKVTTIFDFGSSAVGYSVAVQADGKILVAGQSGSNFALARYNSDSSLDTTFDGDGKVTTSFGSGVIGFSVAVQADGKILVAGYDLTSFALARYNSDGSLDTTFDGDGKIITSFSSGSVIGYSVAVQADGKILVAGSGASYFVLARYNSDGSLDTTFDGDGKVTTSVDVQSYGFSVAVQADGRILVAGYLNRYGTYAGFALARYNSDGSLDTSFDGDGKVTTDFGFGAEGSSVTVQADGKILVAGYVVNGSNIEFALARYNSDGSLDRNFDGDGKVTTNFGSWGEGKSVTVQADGKILVAGYYGPSFSGFALARYNSNGSLDTTFDGDGMVTTSFGSSSSYGQGNSVTVQADGKILVAGSTYNGSNYEFALARYNSDGSPDTSFGPRSTLDAAPTFTEGGTAVILDSTVSIYDTELTPSHYSGATVTLARRGGASPDDVFSSGGALGALTEGAVLTLTGTSFSPMPTMSVSIIGTVSKNSGGTLALLFNSNATQARVDQALSSIYYANTSQAPPTSIVIDWTFNDGNSGTQGSGGALSTTGSTAVSLIGVNDAPTASDTSITMAANSSYTLQTSDFGFLDAEDGTTLTAVYIDSLPASGSLRYSGATMVAGLELSAAEIAAGNLTFTSTSTASGVNYASSQFRVKDSGGAYSGVTYSDSGYSYSTNTLTFGIGSCTYALSYSSQTASADGLTGNLNVITISGCPWIATSNASWITVTSGSSGNGNGSVVYSVAANTSSSARTGTLTIGGQTFTVTQAGASVASPGTWTALPGASPSRPSLALNAATGKTQMVVRSVSDQLYVGNFNSGGTFEGWNALPGASPSVVAQAWHPVLNKMLMVVRAAGDQLYLGTFSSAGSFEGWSALSGASPSPVALAWHATLNKMFMVVRAANDQLYLGTFSSAGSFEGWSALPGASPSPVALAWHSTLNKMFMVVRAANDQLYLGTFGSAGSFEGWSTLSGASPSPVALAWHPASSKMVMAVRGADDQLWQGTFSSTSGVFEGWNALSGSSPTPPVLATGQSNLQLVVRSTDDQLWSLLVQ